MATHGSATGRETPHANQTNHTTSSNTIINALKHRAQAVLTDRTIDPQSRAVIRYALETNDPWLAELVRRADRGDLTVDQIDFSDTPQTLEGDSGDRIQALAMMICQASDESAAALLVLMAKIENATHPKVLANQAKHLAFTHCGELNFRGMVDTQIASIEGELLASNT